MIKKALLAPVLTMCFVQIISTALITYIFPFVASRMHYSLTQADTQFCFQWMFPNAMFQYTPAGLTA